MREAAVKKTAEPGGSDRRHSREELAADFLPGVLYRLGSGENDTYSSGIEALTGYSGERLLAGEPALIDLVHPEDRPRVADELERAALECRGYHLRFRLLSRSGQVHHISDRGRYGELASGAYYREGLLIDESEVVWAQQTVSQHADDLAQLAEQQGFVMRLLQAVTGACEAFVLARGEQAVLEVAAEALSRRCAQPYAAVFLVREQLPDATFSPVGLTGVAIEEVARAGRAADQGGHPAACPALLEEILPRTLSRAEGVVLREPELPGSEAWLREWAIASMVVVPLLYQGQATGALLMASEREDLESARPVVELLARQVVAALIAVRRGRQLESEARRQALEIRRLEEVREDLDSACRQAEERSRRKSRYLAHLSHEIRTPLNGILGMASLLAEGRLDAEQLDALETLRGCADSLLELLDQVLDLSRSEAGVLNLEPVPWSIIELAESVVATVAGPARGKGLRIEVVLESKLPEQVLLDAGRVRQVLVNLMGNAVKFTDRGRVVLRVGKAAGPTGEDELRLLVEDTGCGIPPGQLERIFEPFEQTEEGRRRRGTGLGLAICRELATAMGGEVRADSRPGEGSRFWLQFPLREPALPPSTPGHTSGGVVLASDDRLSCEVIDGLTRQLGVPCAHLSGLDGFETALAEIHGAGPRARIALIDGALGHAASIAETADRHGLAPWLLWSDPRARSPELGKPWKGIVRSPIQRQTLGGLLAGEGGQRPASAARFTAPAALAGTRVLVVDDDHVSRKLLGRLLTLARAEVTLASDAAAARRAYAEEDFDLVLTDWNLPDAEPGTLAAALREIEKGARRERRPIVLCSAEDVETARWSAVGIDAVLPKPVRAEELYAVIGTWIAQPVGVGE
ncbi:MAG TPA: response regulator [Acidobacteria bacterium]|nr:response regulator [Acidobacteriota bacterium]